MGLTFVFVTLGAAVYSVEKVAWVSPQPSLMLTLFLAMPATFILAKLRFSIIAKHCFILLSGAMVFVWQVSLLVAPQPWWHAFRAKPNESTIYFSAFLILGAWLIGYMSTWFMVRKHNAWVAIFLGAAVILLNLNNLPAFEYYRFFPVYVLAAVLLIGHTHLAKRLSQFAKLRQNYTRRSSVYYSSIVVVISLVVASSSIFLPDVHLNPDVAVSTKISWNNSQQEWFNIFAPVKGKLVTGSNETPVSTDILFTDTPSEAKTVDYTVSSNQVSYLRTRRYDTYTSIGWTSPDTVDNTFDPTGGNLTTQLLDRQAFTYTVTNKVKTNVLMVAGELAAVSLPVVLQTFSPQPPSVGPDPGASDIISVIAPRDMLPNEAYTVTSWVSQATPLKLAQAGTDYPDWVTQRYLQLPDTIPARVKELSLQLTEGAQTPYGKAIAIKSFLQRFTYNVVFNTPPQGVDAVDYFLFESKTGDCTYFASAMAVMLRSVGVPSRISSGYYLREKDNTTGQYVIRTRDYHARAEIYFPGYGWIEFETVPGLPGLSTGIDDLSNVGLGNASNVTQNSSYWAAGNVSQLFFSVYHGFVDWFGNPVYFPDSTQSLSLNTTPESPNTTPVISRNVTESPAPNVTAGQSPNAKLPAPQKATSNLSPNATSNKSSNATLVLPTVSSFPGGGAFTGSSSQYPPILIKIIEISLVMLVVGLMAIFSYYRWLDWIKRSKDAVSVYARMCTLASLSKAGPKLVETPHEYGLRLALAFPEQGETIGRITQIYAESRFSKRKELPQTKMGELNRSWFQLYPVLVKRAFRLG